MKLNFKKFISSFVLAALIAVTALTGCNGKDSKDTPASSSAANSTASAETSLQEVGKGNTSFLLEVTDDKGDVTAWKVLTDETTVGAALLEAGLIKGEMQDYGLYITEVNGVAAHYDPDKAYWAFYVNGEFALTGADATDIDPDSTYGLVYTKE